MSSDTGHAHDDHHEAFDPEPVTELAAGETPSPSWLPYVGGVLFFAAVGWLFYPGADAVAKPPEAPAAAASAKAPPAEAKKPTLPGKPRPSGDRPAGDKSPLLRKGAVRKVPGKAP